MATDLHNLSEYDSSYIPRGEGKKIAIVVSEWNSNITENLLQGAYDTLLKFGVSSQDISIQRVPGSFELTFGAKTLIEKIHPDALIMLGCVIQGETPHFTYVCQSVTQGATELNIKYDVPVIFGLLTTTTLEQAKDRAGGRHGNKGDEAAITALKMIALNNREF
ncbi:6,7-dimethyl-8-ribityllumazine synthase [Seramator thermalis]|jgi:6,7-dimethyl-8-ribityllumazine synthase|uniref:6,7-dimethyl-8-ribityllumazine synthase n=1 Tax=Seramator thermalis TaxID=2496270 RepID=UPI00101BA49C|nr:6,7-dimethyl-8-ribityllumazine synthase [Seramator thermalis]